LTEHTAVGLLAERLAEDERAAVDEAAMFLTDFLEGGDQPANAVKAAARRAGIAERTLDRARTQAGVQWKRQGFGPGATYVWRLIHKGTMHANNGNLGEHDERDLTKGPQTNLSPCTPNSSLLANMEGNGGEHGGPESDATASSKGSLATKATEGSKSLASDGPLAEQVASDPDGSLEHLRRLAASWDWPRIYIGFGETIQAGPEAWARFMDKAPADRIAWAIADLESLETGRA
jgi:hypothetical protein